MEKVLTLAQNAGNKGEIPVAAMIVDEKNQLIAQATNEKELRQDPTAHAELLAIRLASQALQTWHLEKCTLYVNLEPCPMCAGAIIHSRLGTVVYGANDPKTGAIRTVINLPDSACSNHHPLVLSGIQEKKSRQLLQNWFKKKRQYNPSAIHKVKE
ncbi:MAG: nucleoside deaminase [Microcystaceae cyanobacterium]